MTEPKPHPVKAFVLLSGGLDSQLAVCLLKEQGLDVTGVSFESPFFDAANARRAAERLHVALDVLDFTADILGLLKAPRHGFGACLNPCIDCHIAMVRRAGEWCASRGGHFVATGEVLNQRPMSQNRRALETVARESGLADRLLRPLSAGLLPETEPERLGWVDRTRLLSLYGRSRRAQLELAARYGLTDYPTPAGGCRLTEPHFAARLKDLRAHEGLEDLRAIRLLRVGRHFRLAPQVKLIVGRNQRDNEMLMSLSRPDEILLRAIGVTGPTGWLPGHATPDEMRRGACICVRYSDAPAGEAVDVEVRQGDRIWREKASAAPDDEIEGHRVR